VTEQRSGSILVWNGLVAHSVPRMDEGSKSMPTRMPTGQALGQQELHLPPMRKQCRAAEQTNGEQSAGGPS
jgi:hypothetical protein